MSHFYATIPHSARKTVASARGHKSTGIETVAASWAGQVAVTLTHDAEHDVDRYRIELRPHHGAGVSQIIADGVVGQPPTHI